ncbi:hypothetical protein FJ366_01445 [Candidatus Dependentiae bacterium]|nr:hypothetical protein [Candidatus Dependentiae bacterium]
MARQLLVLILFGLCLGLQAPRGRRAGSSLETIVEEFSEQGTQADPLLCEDLLSLMDYLKTHGKFSGYARSEELSFIVEIFNGHQTVRIKTCDDF